jgi:hypothetical protein
LLVRDGRDAVVSYAHFVLKTEQGIERPSSIVYENALEEVITSDRFGGWSKNVDGWINRVGYDCIVRYEELIEDPVNIVTATLRRLGVRTEVQGASPPTFEKLRGTVPWFFRKGKSGAWSEEMPSHLLGLFLERHGDTLLRLGYSERVPCRYDVQSSEANLAAVSKATPEETDATSSG